MTPRQARVALGAFALFAAGVTGNALYLQGGSSPAAGSDRSAEKAPAAPSRPAVQPQPPPPGDAKTTKPAPDRATSKAAPAPEPAGEATKRAQTLKVRTVRVATVGETPTAGPPAETGDAETVRAVQAELNRMGYGPLPADGVVRPATRAAIMAYEHEHRLPLTGQATQGLLKLLLFGTPAAAGPAGQVEARSPEAQTMIRQVQQMLTERGYRPGAVDGRLSAETVAAIRTFEADQGLVPKGHISAALLERLESGMGGGGRHTSP
jgi:peptidoglycan hydrolase-like protein with peptidoglycan-binding domain